MRIMVFGHSGSGKSTLAKTLSHHYHIPVLHMDTIHFSQGWVERSKAIRDQELSDFIEKQASWIVDGNYTQAHFQRRLVLADQVFFLDFNRLTCLKNVLLRYKKFKGTSRDSIAEGCDEFVDFAFISWILYRGRNKRRITVFKKAQCDWADKMIVFKNRKQMHRYLVQNQITLVHL